MIAFACLFGNSTSALSRALAPSIPLTPASIYRWRWILNVYTLLVLAPLPFAAVSPRGSRSHHGHADVVHQAPQLYADFVQFGANGHLLVRRVELQATLEIGIVHGTGREVRVAVRFLLTGGVFKAFTETETVEEANIDRF